MKKISVAILAFFLIANFAYSQDAKKALKTAQKDLAKYYQDPMSNADKLTSALESVNQAFQDETVTSDPQSWVVKGEIFNTLADAEMKQKLINPAFEILHPEAASTAFEALKKAIDMSPKKNKAALAALAETESHLNNLGITAFQKEDYANAYTQFNDALDAYSLLKAGDQKSRLDDDVVRNDHKFYTAVSGYYAQVGDKLLPLLNEMYKAGTDKPFVYEALFNIKAEKNPTEGLAILSEGRTKFPSDSGLLFAEINYYLKEGKLDILVDKLKMAIAAEPNNISVYTTLGNVYDQLVTKEREAGNEAKSQEYFDLAKDYYNQALAIDAKSFDAIYSIGALYYNKAAAMTDKINTLANDYSSEGTKKYNIAKKSMDDLFLEAMPYFEKAEGLDPKDLNTLIALKEINARQGKLDKVADYKARIDAIQAGN